ncbi:MAG: diguanylate cyclase [Cyanothece sp. SIO1E1]|nr:diguanylate cyclase [Cyanothece sp. SIO1E1]
MALNSIFYVERPPLENLIYQEVSQPGSVVQLQAPRKMGKSSLLLRVIAYATEQGYETVSLDFQRAEQDIFTNLDKFLRWFCANVSQQLKLELRLDHYWHPDIGSKVSCTLYFQKYLLKRISNPLLLTLNEVNRVLEYPTLAQEFFSLLRSWHEETQQIEVLQKLRLVMVNSTEIYATSKAPQLPFNLGLPIQLPEFTLEQVRDLAQRHGLTWCDQLESYDFASKLMAMVGGHPYLVRSALYHLQRHQMPLQQLLIEAPTIAGIYSDHLRYYLTILQSHPDLATALKRVVIADISVRLEPDISYRLESMGLIKCMGDLVMPSCKLYRLYFGTQLTQGERLQFTEAAENQDERLQQLEKRNQELQQLANIDSLTQIANRRCFDQCLEVEWKRLAREEAPLSLILCDIDFFKTYNDTYGHQQGDDCLQQVAHAIRDSVHRSSDLVARYGGEEFAVLLPLTEIAGALQVAEKIRQTIKVLAIATPTVPAGLQASEAVESPPFTPAIQDIPQAAVVTISLGVASTIPNASTAPEMLIAAADQALYQSKKGGRDRVSVG